MRRNMVVTGAALIVTALFVGTTIHAQRVGGPAGRAGGPNQGPGGPNGPAQQGPAVPNGPVGQPGPGAPGNGGARPLLAQGLDLTEEQRGKIRDLTRAGRDQSANVIDELDLARKQLRREVFADTRNAGKITELTTRIAGLEKQLLDMRVKSEMAVADVLTTAQKQTVRAGAPRIGRGGRAGGGPAPGGPGQGGPRQGPGRAGGRVNG